MRVSQTKESWGVPVLGALGQEEEAPAGIGSTNRTSSYFGASFVAAWFLIIGHHRAKVSVQSTKSWGRGASQSDQRKLGCTSVGTSVGAPPGLSRKKLWVENVAQGGQGGTPWSSLKSWLRQV